MPQRSGPMTVGAAGKVLNGKRIAECKYPHPTGDALPESAAGSRQGSMPRLRAVTEWMARAAVASVSARRGPPPRPTVGEVASKRIRLTCKACRLPRSS